MSASAFTIVLSAALLHATWNLIVKGSGDRLIASWAISMTGAIVNIPVLVVAGLPERAAIGWLAISACFHSAYMLLLAAAYQRIDMAVAYPIARGSAPLIVMIGGIALLGDSVSWVGILGVCLVTGGLMVVGWHGRSQGIAWAFATGAMIASYTLLDGAGVRAGGDALRYLAALFVIHAAVVTAVVMRRRGGSAMLATVRVAPLRLLLGGTASVGAYLLVLIAARDNPLGLVAGLRETSAGFGALAAVVVLHERVTRSHAIAIGVSVAGSLLIFIA